MPLPFGVWADTGRPLEGLDEATLSAFQAAPEAGGAGSEDLAHRAGESEAHFGAIGDVDPRKLEESGWGVIFGASADQKIREALAPLIERRKAMVGDERLFRIFEGGADTAASWLEKQKVRMDVVDPMLGVPLYLMIVAPPEEISFEFQFGLDLYWSVGRLWFPTADEFRQYADSVVRYETMSEVPNARQMAVFAPRHDFDAATQLFADQVATPLVSSGMAERKKFAVQSCIDATATKDALGKIFGTSPALLFSGGHGKAFRPDDPALADGQGALVCQDWGGYGPIGRDQYFEASDLGANAHVHGLVHFLFACYGGGWPETDTFCRDGGTPKTIAPKQAIAKLPQALLAHPNGGALAVLAHIDRAWAYSFKTGRNPQIQGFRDVIGRMLNGDRMGQATDQFNMRWAALSTDLATMLDQSRGLKCDPRVLANQWVARDDARNYILFGDPAVRLRVEDMHTAFT